MKAMLFLVLALATAAPAHADSLGDFLHRVIPDAKHGFAAERGKPVHTYVEGARAYALTGVKVPAIFRRCLLLEDAAANNRWISCDVPSGKNWHETAFTAGREISNALGPAYSSARQPDSDAYPLKEVWTAQSPVLPQITFFASKPGGRVTLTFEIRPAADGAT